MPRPHDRPIIWFICCLETPTLAGGPGKGVSKQIFDTAFKGVIPNYKLPRVRHHKEWQRLPGGQTTGDRGGEDLYRRGIAVFMSAATPARIFISKQILPAKTSHISDCRGQNLMAKHRVIFQQIEINTALILVPFLGFGAVRPLFGQAKKPLSWHKGLGLTCFCGSPG